MATTSTTNVKAAGRCSRAASELVVIALPEHSIVLQHRFLCSVIQLKSEQFAALPSTHRLIIIP